MTKLTWGAPERNKSVILDVLVRVLPKTGRVLEIASGSGQHVIHFAARLPDLTFQPSDVDAANLASIRAWIAEIGLHNVQAPLALDVCAPDWGVTADAIFNANMLHIAPWACAVGLFEGATRHLSGAGVLVLYGPYHIDGQPTSESNAAFDADLRRRDPSWGVRDVRDVSALGERNGFVLEERIAMPANNQTLVFRRRPA
jgi:cyclopropane fatty-acyl-phospholipid synthase-like methyltransferase